MVGVFFTIVMFGDIQGVGGPQKPRGTQIDVWGFFSKMDEISTLCFFFQDQQVILDTQTRRCTRSYNSNL